MRRVMIVLAVVLIAPAASAQPTGGVFAGFAYTHSSFEDVHLSTGESLNGWLGGVDVAITSHLGIVARVDGSYGDVFRQGLVVGPPGNEVRSALYLATAGPRVSLTTAGLTLFADGVVGVAHGKARSMGVDFIGAIEDTKLVGGIGGGVNLRVSRLVDLQVDAQYRRTNLFDQALNIVQVGVGIVLRPMRR